MNVNIKLFPDTENPPPLKDFSASLIDLANMYSVNYCGYENESVVKIADINKGSIILDLIVEGFETASRINWVETVKTVLKNGGQLIELGQDAFICYAVVKKAVRLLKKWFGKCRFESAQINDEKFNGSTVRILESFCESIEKKVVRRKETVLIDSNGRFVSEKTVEKYYVKSSLKEKIDKKRGKQIKVLIKEYSNQNVSWMEVIKVYEK